MPDAPGAVKTSVFTIRVPDGESVVWFNSASGELLRLATDRNAFLERHLARVGGGDCGTGDPLVIGLTSRGFLAPAGVDEFEAAHARYLADRDDEGQLFLTVAPTLGCNARCSYCFQQDLKGRGPMGRATREALVDFVRARSTQLTGLAVQWFGGEPLLAMEVMEECTRDFREICAGKGARYRASLLTNGLLLQRPALWRRVASLDVTEIQIPLDGLPASYARRKRIPLWQAERFYAFLVANAEEIAGVTGRLIVNINVDRDNVEEACEVIDLFASAGVTDERVQLRLGILGTDRNLVKCIPHDCLGVDETHEARTDFDRYLHSRGMHVPGPPGPLPWPCVAVAPGYFTVDPEGRLGGCAPLTGATGEATLQAGSRSPSVRSSTAGLSSELHGYDPFLSPRCAPCPLLPACLGSCPRRGLQDDGAGRPPGVWPRPGSQAGSQAGAWAAPECPIATRIIRQVVEASRAVPS